MAGSWPLACWGNEGEELSRGSADFARLWQAGDVAALDAGIKRLLHPTLGEIALEYSAFAVDGRPDLTMLVFTPVGQAAEEQRHGLRARLPCLVEQ